VPGAAAPTDRTEIDLPGLDEHEIVAYRLPPDSAIARGRDLPRWARPVLVRRERQVITAPRQFEAGDQVYFLATPPQVPLLDKLLAAASDAADEESTLYGDFAIGAAVTFKALRETYGLSPTSADDRATLAELFEREFATDLELGDRLHLGPVDLIAREIGDGRLLSVGIALEPTPPRGLARTVRAWLARTIGMR